MTTDITELTGAPKHANQHRLSRLIIEAPNDELRQLAVEVEQYTDQLIEALDKAQQRIDELENDEVRQRLANAEHQLYMAELAKHNLKASRKAQFRKRRAAEKRIAELEEAEQKLCAANVTLDARAELAERQLAELESRLNSADKLQDSAFRSGLQHGFSLGQTDDQKGYEHSMAAYSPAAGIREAE
ncbi:hypothetical protein [Klebsiella pasteurii]|uniref:hypothetical protein n=1 Tax=Klebsiella pasteurii TaxID=2587529 RepID=UPI00292CCAB3|nr:hypothetical protein [Klebsiella pasteurii]